MHYINENVIYAMLAVTFIMTVRSIWQKNLGRSLLFGGLLAFAIHIWLGAKAASQLIDGFREVVYGNDSLLDSSKNVVDGFAALPQATFDFFMWAGVALIFGWALVASTSYLRSRRAVSYAQKLERNEMRASDLLSNRKGDSMAARIPGDIQFDDGSF